MWIKKIGIGLLTVFTLFVSRQVLAQEEEKSECVIKLEEAQQKYNQGRIQDVEPLIGKCVEGEEFNKADKTQAYKLLTLSYIFLKELELAEGTMLKLLETNHEFEINETVDPSEFINLYNKYRTEPLVSIGILGGAVVGQPVITSLNGAADLNGDRQKYTPQIGFRVGLNAEYKLFDKWYANPGIGFTHMAIKKTFENDKVISDEPLGGFEGVLNFNIIELPLLMQYQFLEGKLRPYAVAGIVPQFFASASYPGDVTKNSIEGSADATQGTLSLNEDLNRFNFAVTIAGGVKFKAPAGFINARIRYNYGMINVFKSESGTDPSDPNLIWDLKESLDGFKIQDLSIYIGYTYHIYIPKKLR